MLGKLLLGVWCTKGLCFRELEQRRDCVGGVAGVRCGFIGQLGKEAMETQRGASNDP